jgi:hypothetical protein
MPGVSYVCSSGGCRLPLKFGSTIELEIETNLCRSYGSQSDLPG